MRRTLLFGLAIAASIAQAGTLTHAYYFQNSLVDSIGSDPLTPHGGVLDASGYTFGANQGLSLANPFVTLNDYSIEILFYFSGFPGFGGFDKILDFTNLQGVTISPGYVVDPGIYSENQYLTYWDSSQKSSTPVFTAGQYVDLVLTHDTTGTVTAYVDGSMSFTFADGGTSSKTSATLSSSSDPLWFFVDDFHSFQTEAGPGKVSRIRIWDGALAAQEVAQLGAPEPGTCSLLVAGLGIIIAAVSRRKAGPVGGGRVRDCAPE